MCLFFGRRDPPIFEGDRFRDAWSGTSVYNRRPKSIVLKIPPNIVPLKWKQKEDNLGWWCTANSVDLEVDLTNVILFQEPYLAKICWLFHPTISFFLSKRDVLVFIPSIIDLLFIICIRESRQHKVNKLVFCPLGSLPYWTNLYILSGTLPSKISQPSILPSNRRTFWELLHYRNLC